MELKRAPADTVLLGGAVRTMDPSRPRAEAVAVRDGRIAAVGTRAGVEDLIGPRTEVLDLGGGLLLPGFQDAHVHPVDGGLERLRCDLTGGATAADYVRLVGEYVASHPDVEWVLGAGWSLSAFPGGIPTRQQLDAAAGGRPAFLPNRDGHGAWVNTRALELAGIGRDTADPEDGRIERDAAGDAVGMLQEGAMDLVRRVAPAPSDEEQYQGLLEGQRYLHSLGITAWQDAMVGASLSGRDTFPTYIRAAEEGTLTARVAGAQWWDRHDDESQIEGMKARRAEAARTGRFRAGTVKIMQDGIVEDFTAGMLDPYLDASGRPTANRGMSFVEPEALKRYVTTLDAEGFQVHVHAIGDRAVREALDAFEAALQANGPNDHRHHIAHVQVVHPDDLPRFARLGVTANAQPLWATNEPQMTELTLPFLGRERSGWQYPFARLVASGARLACGSDWSVSSPNPLWGTHVAVNRTDPDPAERREPFMPEEAIDLQTALGGYTTGAAYVNHLEREVGSIEAGKVADLVVLDRDPFDGPPSEIAAVQVVRTLVDGRSVYVRPAD